MKYVTIYALTTVGTHSINTQQTSWNTAIDTHFNSTVVAPFFLLRQIGLKLWDATGSRWVDECSGNERKFKLSKHYPIILLRL
jgi:hypothetical protein